MVSPSDSATDDGWKIVTRRRRPPHFLPSPTPRPQLAKVLSPNSLSYAQVLMKKPPAGTGGSNVPVPPSQPNINSSPPPNVQPVYAKSPHSPTMLRYPPKPNYKEWWGRCFRCTQRGHIVSECQFPRWYPNPKPNPQIAPRQDAHPIHTIPKTTVLSAGSTVQQTSQVSPIIRDEPSFEEFLAESEPLHEPEMPPNRPLKLQCYFNRDKHYTQHLERMLSGIVVQSPDHLTSSLTLDQVAALIASSKRVSAEQLQVAILSKDKFIVMLPSNLDRSEILSTVPKGVWDQGFKLFSYSPLLLTDISIPMFKVWIDVIDVPLELHHEVHMARAISSFGCYLGSMEPREYGDCRTWSVFLATDDLQLVPHQLQFRIGGLVYNSVVRPRKWVQGQVYQHSDLPPPPITFQPPPSEFTNPQLALKEPSAPDPMWFRGDDVIHMSLKALREIFRGVDPTDLPPDLVECLAGNEAAIKANNEAGKLWDHQNRPNGAEPLDADNIAQVHATQDPSQDLVAIDPAQSVDLNRRSSHPRHDAGRGSSHAAIATVQGAMLSDVPTVHRTDAHRSRGKRPQEDLAIQVCSQQSFVNLREEAHPWEARDLFPEIGTPPTQPVNQAGTKKCTQKTKSKARKTVPAIRPRRTSNRLARKKGGDGSVLDIDAHNFIDIPLQHSEGVELLSLIGAGNINIPSQLMCSPQQKQVQLEMGQPSHAPVKKKKQDGPQPSPQSVQEDLAANRGDNSMAIIQFMGQQPEDDAINACLDEEHIANADGLDDLDDPMDDRYLDKVDYSDDDPLF